LLATALARRAAANAVHRKMDMVVYNQMFCV
jgi:hypothetical protein